MATFARDSSQRCDKSNMFKKIRKKIEDTFDIILQKVIERRDYLLQQLTELEGDGSDKMKSSKKEMELLLVTLQSEEAKKSLQKSIDELTEKISDYENELSFVCETNELEWDISKLGVLSTVKEIENTAIIVQQYKSIKTPLISFGTRGTETKQFSAPRGVLVDEDRYRIFICDNPNRIQIWSIYGEYLSEFGTGTLSWPWEIVHHGTSLFVSDFETHRLSKWCYNSLKLIAKSSTTHGSKRGQLNNPAGLDIYSGEVYVLDCSNNRISVFDLDLRFKRVMADQIISEAYCLRIRFNVIYIVEVTGVIKLFSKYDQLIRKIDRSDLFSDLVFHFNFDSTLNFLLTDRDKNSLYILSPEGKVIHCISFDAWGVKEPFGIDVIRNGNIVISFQEGSAAAIIC